MSGTCATCRWFQQGSFMGVCARAGGPLGALRLDATHWLCHREAKHPCHEPKDPPKKERPA